MALVKGLAGIKCWCELRGLSYNLPWRRRKGMEVWLNPFFTLGARWDWVVNATPRPLNPLRIDPVPIFWVGPRAVLDGYGKSRSHRTVQHLASRYTDWAIPALNLMVKKKHSWAVVFSPYISIKYTSWFLLCCKCWKFGLSYQRKFGHVLAESKIWLQISSVAERTVNEKNENPAVRFAMTRITTHVCSHKYCICCFTWNLLNCSGFGPTSVLYFLSYAEEWMCKEIRRNRINCIHIHYNGYMWVFFPLFVQCSKSHDPVWSCSNIFVRQSLALTLWSTNSCK